MKKGAKSIHLSPPPLKRQNCLTSKSVSFEELEGSTDAKNCETLMLGLDQLELAQSSPQVHPELEFDDNLNSMERDELHKKLKKVRWILDLIRHKQ